MSHKDFVSQWNKFEYQEQKTKHYQNLDTLLKELFGERTKENGLFQQINDLEKHLTAVRRGLHDVNINPDRMVSMVLPNTNVFLSYTSGEAGEMLVKDQNNLVRDIETLRTQFKLCCEHQIELEKKLRVLPVWTMVLEKQGQKIQH